MKQNLEGFFMNLFFTFLALLVLSGVGLMFYLLFTSVAKLIRGLG